MNPQHTVHYASDSPYECGKSYNSESPLVSWLREHRHNLREGLLVKTKPAKHAYGKAHRLR
jgi:hypothetical protein